MQSEAKALLARMSLSLDDLPSNESIGFSNGAQWIEVATVDEIRSAALSVQERAVEVKGLDWRVFCSRSGNCEAKTPFGEYVIQSERDGWMLYLLNEQDAHMAYSTIDYAKSAAQSDYEQRILSALKSEGGVE